MTRARYGHLESVVSLIGNSLLLVSKLVIGIMISSIALFGDSMNHLTDVAISIVILFGFRLAKKEADLEHPFGHARAEQILSIAVATMVVVMGVAILAGSAQSFANPEIRSQPVMSVFILFLAGVKELMARFAFGIGRKIDSKVLVADGWNHRFDAIISVVIAVGIYATLLDDGLSVLDPLLGVVVAVVIIITGIKLIKDSADELMGQAPPPEVVETIIRIAKASEGVLDAHDVKIHSYGTREVMSLHVVVEDTITAKDAHAIASEVESAIRHTFRVEPTVHVETIEAKRTVEELEAIVSEIVGRYHEVHSSHNIRVVPHGMCGDVDMHILVDRDMNVEDVHELVHNMADEIRLELEGYEVRIHVEPCDKECKTCEEVCSKGHE